jgi:site-specific DNA-methyltransferase (adenine-specific)
MGLAWDRIRGDERLLGAAKAGRIERVDGLSFGSWCESWARECIRLLTPGGHLLAFGGTRRWHRLAAALEDAGFEIRDSIAWLYGACFPKSLDIAKAMGAEDRRWRGWEPA